MASFNKVILMGNLTRDPELRYTPKGTAVAKLGLAVNRVWKTETGETKEDVLFIDVEAFSGKAARRRMRGIVRRRLPRRARANRLKRHRPTTFRFKEHSVWQKPKLYSLTTSLAWARNPTR